MTTIEVAAMLASSILVKGSVVAAGLMIAGRFVAKSASRATLITRATIGGTADKSGPA